MGEGNRVWLLDTLLNVGWGMWDAGCGMGDGVCLGM